MDYRFHLNEQEKKRILQLHKTRLNENIIVEQSIQDIQNIIIQNGGKIAADNKLGPRTLNAIYDALTQGFAKDNKSTTETPTQTNTTETPTQTNTTETPPTLSATPAKEMSVQTNTQNQQLATGPVRSAKEIKQDYRQRQRQEKQVAKQTNRNNRELEKELENLESRKQRLQGKMTPADELAYNTQISKLKTKLGRT